jgi:hypothetical protein
VAARHFLNQKMVENALWPQDVFWMGNPIKKLLGGHHVFFKSKMVENA